MLSGGKMTWAEASLRSSAAAVLLGMLAGVVFASAEAQTSSKVDLAAYDVVWNAPGQSYKDSMPVGNGDIGANVWTEGNGDVLLLLSKTDAYSENGELVKLGRVRIHTSPSIFNGEKFLQALHLDQGQVEVRNESDGSRMRVWADANHPVLHIDWTGSKATKVKATVELWRATARVTRQNGQELAGRAVLRELNGIPSHEVTIYPDTALVPKPDQLMWEHHNVRSVYPLVLENQHLQEILKKYPDPLLDRTFGVAMRGEGLHSTGPLTLESVRESTSGTVDLYELTARAPNVSDWASALDKLVAEVRAVDREKAYAAHNVWWKEFWSRSWVDIAGSDAAATVSQGYAIQRYMNAAGGRGSIPIKYNGSIFTVGQEPPPGSYDPAKGQRDPDYRDWGSNFWLQNTRLMYWPMVAAGDYDLLAPFLKMYREDLPLETDRNRIYFHHPGASYPETMYFWGTPGNIDFGWGNPSVVMNNHWIRYYVSGGIEVTAIMLSVYANTHDQRFLRNTLLPVADAITQYYDNHWSRVAGKIRMDPAQAIETRQQAVDPTPDIAGLRNILPRLLALPKSDTTAEQRNRWMKMLADLPPIPTGRTDARGKIPEMGQQSSGGKPVILPAASYSHPGNVENAELYAVFPFQQYGVGLPDLELARNTYDARVFKSSTCWGQDGMDAAMLGWADRARAEAVANFTAYGKERFAWFWKAGHDWEPDMDNGGAGMSIVQLMLMQTRGDNILLFPAWPASWDVRFKLHGPKNTTVEGVFEKGKLQSLKVTPESRRRDVTVMTPQP